MILKSSKIWFPPLPLTPCFHRLFQTMRHYLWIAPILTVWINIDLTCKRNLNFRSLASWDFWWFSWNWKNAINGLDLKTFSEKREQKKLLFSSCSSHGNCWLEYFFRKINFIFALERLKPKPMVILILWKI